MVFLRTLGPCRACPLISCCVGSEHALHRCLSQAAVVTLLQTRTQTASMGVPAIMSALLFVLNSAALTSPPLAVQVCSAPTVAMDTLRIFWVWETDITLTGGCTMFAGVCECMRQEREHGHTERCFQNNVCALEFGYFHGFIGI